MKIQTIYSMDKWFRYLKETRSSAAGIKRSIKTLTDMGGNTGGNPTGYKRIDDPLQGKKKKNDISAPPGAPGGGSVGASGPALEEEVEADSFRINDDLEPRIWDGMRMKEEIREPMLKIAKNFIDGLPFDIKIEDITLTGSLANYNWSSYSDVDLHIIVDFSKIDENYDLVKGFFDNARARWNDKHNVTLKGYDVEIYVENVGEGHKSSGVYSVMGDEWNIEPNKYDDSIDFESARRKADEIESRVNRTNNLILSGDYQKALRAIDKLKRKIRNMRRAGLESKKQEFSVENIAFKILRRNGILDRLDDLKTDAYDFMVGLDEVNSEVY
jgi:predicted nucleotidyltransferase